MTVIQAMAWLKEIANYPASVEASPGLRRRWGRSHLGVVHFYTCYVFFSGFPKTDTQTITKSNRAHAAVGFKQETKIKKQSIECGFFLFYYVKDPAWTNFTNKSHFLGAIAFYVGCSRPVYSKSANQLRKLLSN